MGRGRGSDGRPLVSPMAAIAAMFLAPLGAALVQMAISRSREFEADRMGAEISGQPLWLASALARLSVETREIPNPTAQANPATAHLYIANPLSAGGMRSLFSTHPPMEERIARLQAMAGQMSRQRYPSSAATAAASRSRGPWG